MASTTKSISGEDELPPVAVKKEEVKAEVKKEEVKPEVKAPAPIKAEPVIEVKSSSFLTDEEKFKIREGVRIG